MTGAGLRSREASGRPIYDAPSAQIDYFDGSDQLFVDYEHRARLLCSPGEGLIQLSITGREEGDEVLATHPLLTIALVETMKRFERFPLHAAGLALHGKGVLIPGAVRFRQVDHLGDVGPGRLRFSLR